MKRKRIAFTPLFSFEAGCSTFIDQSRFEIVPITLTSERSKDQYGQSVFGDWCAPLKFMVASYEYAIAEQGVEAIVGLNFNICSYPFVLGNLHNWIKRDFEYYPINVNKLSFSPFFIADALKQLQKALPGLSTPQFLKLLPQAQKRIEYSDKLKNIYYKYLPLVKSPLLYKKKFTELKHKFLEAKDLRAIEKLYRKFEKTSDRMKVRENPTYKIVLSGDAEIILAEFTIFEIDIFLASHQIEVIQGSMAYEVNRKSEIGKKTEQIISSDFSSENNKTPLGQQHLLEASTLYHVLSSIKQNADGVIFIKPNMCAPCDNVSFILKQENYFDLPFVEVSYDEHSGVNGMVTRLEAFINILKDSKQLN